MWTLQQCIQFHDDLVYPSSKNTATPLVIYSLKFYKFLYLGWYKNCLEVEARSDGTLGCKIVKRYIPKTFGSILLGLIPSAILCLLAYSQLMNGGVGVDAPFFVIFLQFFFAGFGIELLLLYLVVVSYPQLAAGYNEINQVFKKQQNLEIAQQQQPAVINKHANFDLLGVFSSGAIMEILLPSFVIPIFLVWMKLDPFFYLVNPFLPTSPPVALHYSIFAFRFSLTFIFWVEYARSGYLISFLGLSWVFPVFKIMEKLLKHQDVSNRTHLTNCTVVYHQLQILLNIVKIPLQHGSSISMGGDHCCIAFMALIIIRGFDTLSFPILFILMAVLTGQVLFLLLFTAAAGTLNEKSLKLVLNMRCMLYAHRRESGHSKLMLKVWKACKNLEGWYAVGLVFTRKSVGQHLGVMADNIINLLLLW
ncbi:unnamed protein product [Orchesella dallaii]|uniref:Odorant receptor n=1 Tax=Orchesella dallaii TaxID=48710 RepID=A0ABP1RAL3_9HEXA